MARRRRDRGPRERPAADSSRYRRLENPYRPLEVLSEDQVAHLHERAVAYLADEGIRVLLPEARRIYEGGGAVVDDETQMVRLDPGSVTQALADAPERFELGAPNPDRSVPVGGNSVALVPVGGPPFLSGLEGRRAGAMADQENFLRLMQTYDVLAVTSPAVEPDDIPINTRHLASGRATLTLTDKAPFVYARGRARCRDSIDLIKLRYGIETDAEFAEAPRCWTNINTNSPRQIDVPMAMAIIDFARWRQPCIMTPFTLAGAMAPVTLAGALVLQHMEALAAITLAQLTQPGAPVMYGAFTSNVDMKSGSPAFGTPEAIKGALASGQLARHIGVPWRSSGSSASTSVDAQAGYETMMNTFGALLGGANWIQHAAGWQEGGLAASYEKLIVDVEMCQMIAESLRPLAFGDAELALDAITEVGPGGHFFGTAHTLERFETAFYQPLVFSRATYEQWTEEGSRRTDQRAEDVWRQALADYEQPPLDDAIADALDDFVERRVAEGGAAPD
ncbi:MAG: trimethylamine methyltransferase family protein [Actinomycetota bacterium]